MSEELMPIPGGCLTSLEFDRREGLITAQPDPTINLSQRHDAKRRWLADSESGYAAGALPGVSSQESLAWRFLFDSFRESGRGRGLRPLQVRSWR